MASAVEVINDMIDCYLDSDLYGTLAERLEMLRDLADDLKSNNYMLTHKDFIDKLKKKVVERIDQEIEDKELCPDCFSDTKLIQTYTGNYYNPPEYKIVCEAGCGWEE